MNSTAVVYSFVLNGLPTLVSLFLDMQHYCVYVDVSVFAILFSILLYHYVVPVLKSLSSL